MCTIEPIELLICGTASLAPSDERDAKAVVLAGLGRHVVSYLKFALEFKTNLNTEQASYFMPVALRSLMESASIALLARFDPLRVIHSSLSQDCASYNKSRPQASALKWKGDIVGADDASNKPEANDGDATPKKGKVVWDPNIGSAKLPRHLLSDQVWEAFWMPSAKSACAWLTRQGHTSSAWLNELATKAPENLQRSVIGDGNKLYSELSKGIHPEFAVRRESEFDAPTLETLLEDTVKWVAILGWISHFASGLSAGVNIDNAFDALLTVENNVNGK